MTITSRRYVDADLPRVQAALAAWVKQSGACGYCHPGGIAHRIYAELRGRHRVEELVRVWEEGPSIVGIAITLRFDAAFDVFTSPSHRGTDAELEMLQSAYETTVDYMKQADREDAAVVTDVFSCDHVRADLVTRLGFEHYRLWDYITERSLSRPVSEPLMPEGFTIRSATMDDYEQLASVRNDAFGHGWSPELFRDEVMRKPGYHPEAEFVVMTPDQQIAALTATWLDELNRVGLFEPVGTRREFRRRGLARAMMLHGLREMRSAGMETAMVQHDARNLPALELYRNLGFKKRYETLGYRRTTT